MTANELMRYVSDNTDVVIVALRSSEETAPRKYCLGSSRDYLGKLGTLPVTFVTTRLRGYESELVIVLDGYKLDDGEYDRLAKAGGHHVDC